MSKSPSSLHITSRRPLGRTSLRVTPVCIGTASWGERGHDGTATERACIEAALRVFDSPLNYLDTSNNYGRGTAERWLGAAIREHGGLPDGFILQTKADRDMDTGEFSGARMRRSLEESLERLGLEHLPILFLHDPEHTTFESAMATGGPVETLLRFKQDGLVSHIGVAGGPIDLMIRYIETGLFEAVITHNRFTLIDSSAEPLIDRACQLGVAVLNAAPFGGGILASYPIRSTDYAYAKASREIISAVTAMGNLLQSAGIPLGAAALQWSLRDPRIDSTLVGALEPGHVDDAIELACVQIGADLWQAVADLRPREQPMA
jgi:D-threo-aldose 1-dehydrogenase